MSAASRVASPSAEAVDVILRDGGTLRLRAPAHDDADALLGVLRAGSPSGASTCASTGCARSTTSSSSRSSTPTGSSAARSSARSPAATATSGSSRSRATRGCATRPRPRSRSPSPTTPAGPRDRHAPARAARGARAPRHGHRALRRRGDGRRTAAMLRRLRGRRLRGRRASSTAARSRCSFPIAATERYRARVDERDHVAVAASLRPFFAAASVAVIGASRRRGSIGGELFRNILAADFAGAAYPVNLSGEPVAGVRAYASIGEIPDAVDLAVICVPGRARARRAPRRRSRAGSRALCVISAGFAEIGAEGRERQEHLLALVRAHGARLVGPNCLGIAVPRRRPERDLRAARAAARADRLLVAERRARARAAREGRRARARLLGLRLDREQGRRLLERPARVVGGRRRDRARPALPRVVRQPAQVRAARPRASRGAKPILALKAGRPRAGARAASSHTAALAGSDDRGRRALPPGGRDARRHARGAGRRGGAALDASRCRAAAASRVLTNAGGLGILCADACEAAGLELPELGERDREPRSRRCCRRRRALANPVDLLGSATAATYEAAIPPLLADPRVDALIVLFVPPVVAGADEVARRDPRRRGARATDKPVLAVVISADGTPAALRDGERRGRGVRLPGVGRAGARPRRRARRVAAPAGRRGPRARRDRPEAARRIVGDALGRRDDVWLDAGASRARCSTAYGIPLVPERVASTPTRPSRRRGELGFPVVVKTAAAGAHKTESGGVALDLARRAAGSRRRRADRRAGARRSRWSAAAPSCSPASSRTRSSARSSRSGPAACSPS